MRGIGTLRDDARLGPAGTGGGGGLPGDKLVYVSSRFWPDTVAAGATITAFNDFREGDAYTAKLFAQYGWVQPPADALSIVGGELRATASYANVLPGTYILKMHNVTTDRVTLGLVHIYSNKTATHTVSSRDGLLAALDEIGGDLQAQGAGFGGAVIDIAPGDYGDVLVDQVPDRGQTRMVILRSASTDRLNGEMPRFARLILRGCKYIGVQSLRQEPYLADYGVSPLSPMLGFGYFGDNSGQKLTTENCWVFNQRVKGGSLEWNGAGLVRCNPALTVDPQNNWFPVHTHLRGNFSVSGTTGTYTRIDLYRGHDAVLESGAALGVWKAATVPAYVGPNTPNGQAGIFGKVDIVPRPNPSVAGVTPTTPADFDAEFEVAFLTSTPTATVNGGPQTKPAGGPDGNYIVAWRLINGGSWTGVASTLAVLSLGWRNQASFFTLPSWMDVGGTAREVRNLVVSNCHVEEVEDGIRAAFVDAESSIWTVGNTFDKIVRDWQQFFWFWKPTSGIERWGPVPGQELMFTGHFDAFNNGGRTITLATDWLEPHGDSRQYARRAPPQSGLISGVQTYTWLVGTFTVARDTRLGRGLQGPFYSDMFQPSNGYRLVSQGNFVDCIEPNGWGLSNQVAEYSLHDSVISRFGSGNERYPSDPEYPTLSSRQRATYGTLGPTVIAPVGSFYRDHRSSAGNSDAVWSAPLFSYTLNPETLRARFTAVGDNAGYGAFGDPALSIDHVNRVWNPNLHEFRLGLAETVNHPVNTLVRSVARQLIFGTKPLSVSVTGGLWSKGATREEALAATPTSAPGTLSPGEWIVLWVTTSPLSDVVRTVTATIGGVASSFSARTAAALPFPASGVAGNITRQTFGVSVSARVQDIFADVNVPAGCMAVALVSADGGAATEVVEPSAAYTGWTELFDVPASASCRAVAYSWYNGTGSTVQKSLRLDFGADEQFSCVLYIIPRTQADTVLLASGSAGSRATSGTWGARTLNKGITRRYLGLSIAAVDGTATIAAAPADWTNLQAVPGANVGGAGAFTFERFVQASSLTAGSLTVSPSEDGVYGIVAVWEAYP